MRESLEIACVFMCLHARVIGMLACSRAYHDCFVCLHTCLCYVLTYSHVIHVYCAKIYKSEDNEYIISRASLRNWCPCLSYFFIFEKLKSKNFYVEKFALFRGVFRTNLNVYDGDFCENSKG